MFERLAVCCASRIEEVDWKEGEEGSCQSYFKVDSGGRKEQALMLGLLLWDQVPSDATKTFSRRLCRSADSGG